MRAVGYRHSRSLEDAEYLVDLHIEQPKPVGRDLLVQVKAISVNPIDAKIRKRVDPKGGAPKILGYDAAGTVIATGSDAALFRAGDDVFYAEVGRGGEGRSLLIVGAGGGVGSIAIQIARALTTATVIATASRPETREWCKALGAHHVIDHTNAMAGQMQAIGCRFADYIFGVNGTDRHYNALSEIIAPQGKLGIIDDPGVLEVNKMKGKSASLHWVSMFMRSSFQTPDMEAQHRLLNEVSKLVDNGSIRTTAAENLGTINAAHLRNAHALIESGRIRGKVVLEGF
jgi:NADPH:quinone reductase-like Zn-dependent oxidoreductase